MNDLAAALMQGREGDERTGWARACFFLDFATCRRQQVFVLVDLTFRNGPGAIVLPCPEWASGMDQQYFERARPLSEQQKTGALFAGHQVRRRHRQRAIRPATPERAPSTRTVRAASA